MAFWLLASQALILTTYAIGTDDEASLLQLAGTVHRRDDGRALEVSKSADSALAAAFNWPLFFLKIPKTGGNFATTLAHAACACLPAEAYLQTAEIPHCCDPSRFARFRVAWYKGGHLPLRGDDFEALGEPRTQHVVLMLRNPIQRLISGFYHHRHDCASQRQQLAPGCELLSKIDDPMCSRLRELATAEDLEAYASCVGGCTARMLHGAACGVGPEEDHVVSQADLSVSLANVQAAAFVGLTDEYSLSVCLWHVRFGGPCLAVEFGNYRSGVHRRAGGYVAEAHLLTSRAKAALQADEVIFAKASMRFWQEIREYNISKSKCDELCPHAPAGSFLAA